MRFLDKTESDDWFKQISIFFGGGGCCSSKLVVGVSDTSWVDELLENRENRQIWQFWKAHNLQIMFGPSLDTLQRFLPPHLGCSFPSKSMTISNVKMVEQFFMAWPHTLHLETLYLRNSKNPGCLGYIGDCTTQLCGVYNKPLYGSLLNNQYSGKQEDFFRGSFPLTDHWLTLPFPPKKCTWMFPKIVGFPPKSPIFIGFSIINHPFWGIPIFGNTHLVEEKVRPRWWYIALASCSDHALQMSC